MTRLDVAIEYTVVRAVARQAQNFSELDKETGIGVFEGRLGKALNIS